MRLRHMSEGAFYRLAARCLILPCLFALGCDSDVTLPDRSAPGDITDLMAVPQGHGAVMLSWTAPGDDGYVGIASEYDIRYSRTCDVDCVLWDKQCWPRAMPVPAAPGRADSLLVEGLAPATEYCFTIRTVDDKRFWSGWSNVAPCTTGFSLDEVTRANDAEMLALDISGEPEAPEELVALIQRDLDTIRAEHPFLWTIHTRHHSRQTDITSESRGSYTFFYKWGDCYAGCAHSHYWTVYVMSGEVTLIDEGGSLLPCAPWCYD